MNRAEALAILGFDQAAAPTEEQLKTAYRQAAGKHHPDRGGNPADFQTANDAFNFLSTDPNRRKQSPTEMKARQLIAESNTQIISSIIGAKMNNQKSKDQMEMMMRNNAFSGSSHFKFEPENPASYVHLTVNLLVAKRNDAAETLQKCQNMVATLQAMHDSHRNDPPSEFLDLYLESLRDKIQVGRDDVARMHEQIDVCMTAYQICMTYVEQDRANQNNTVPQARIGA